MLSYLEISYTIDKVKEMNLALKELKQEKKPLIISQLLSSKKNGHTYSFSHHYSSEQYLHELFAGTFDTAHKKVR